MIALRRTTVKAPTGRAPSRTTWEMVSCLLVSLSEPLDAFLGDAGRVRTAELHPPPHSVSVLIKTGASQQQQSPKERALDESTSGRVKNQRLVYSYVSAGNENLELLQPFVKECTVNGKCCRVLRDSAATVDVVHPSHVSAKDFTNECAWIRQVMQEHSVCLPLARVHIEGLFGAFRTEAAVSARLPTTDEVCPLTRSKARELARQLNNDPPALIDACEAPQPNADGPAPERVAYMDARTVAITDAAFQDVQGQAAMEKCHSPEEQWHFVPPISRRRFQDAKCALADSDSKRHQQLALRASSRNPSGQWLLSLVCRDNDTPAARHRAGLPEKVPQSCINVQNARLSVQNARLRLAGRFNHGQHGRLLDCGSCGDGHYSGLAKAGTRQRPFGMPRKQPTKGATAADTPDGSPSTRDDEACVVAPPTAPLPSETTGDSVAATPAAPFRIAGGKRRRGQRKTCSKRRRKQREFEPSTAVAPAAPRPANTTVTAPHPLPAKDDFVTVVSKAAQRRAKALAAAAIATDPAVVGAVLYPPSAPGGTFKGSPRLTLAATFATRPDVVAVRINHRRNIVAAEASTQPCLSELLTIKELNGVPVTARVPADRRTSVGFVHGVDGKPSDKQLLEGITSTVPVVAATRQGSTVRLQFAGSQSPERYGMPDRVPSSADNAGASGTSPRHASVSATASHAAYIIRPPPGRHAADNPTCPRWQEERRVAMMMAAAPTPLSRRAVKAAVRKESREVRSYAAAAKTNLPESDTTDPGLQRPSAAPRRSLLLPAISPVSSPPAAPPAEPSDRMPSSLAFLPHFGRWETTSPKATPCVLSASRQLACSPVPPRRIK
ncbi:hypothetical protein HPB52_013017 [Rhipicephalus sanguineus]|uniref:Uncharacterized protein n=1 Tax=Rhipicephalus sanguineus TaxID=34632 RepID=A0A9D4SQY3_RHISA|nr:hypothetical protein HPB52_013017 [Rhipicephalus sanguineus]